nr:MULTISPECIES: hypothetical protein [unclassified Caulobacter]
MMVMGVVQDTCHPGRSAGESRDPGATAMRRPLGPGSTRFALDRDDSF